MPAPYDPIELDKMMDAAMPLVPEMDEIPSNEDIAKMEVMMAFDRSGGIQAIEAQIGLRLNEWKDQGGLEDDGVSYLYVIALGLLKRELRGLKAAQASKGGDSIDGEPEDSNMPDKSVESAASTGQRSGHTSASGILGYISSLWERLSMRKSSNESGDGTMGNDASIDPSTTGQQSANDM